MHPFLRLTMLFALSRQTGNNRLTKVSRTLLRTGLGLLFTLAFAAFPASAQQILTPFELQAITVALGGKTLTKLTLSGSATWIAGSVNETGNVSLSVDPDGSVSELWSLPTRSHSVSETGFSEGKSCSVTDKSGKQHENAAPNCVQPVTWFAPWVALNLLSFGDLLSAADATQPSEQAAGLVNLRFITQLSGASDAKSQAKRMDVANRTAVNVLFDRGTALPSSLTFNYVLDNDPKHVIEYVTTFADYRPEQGFMIPHRIQRYIQRTLQADITVTSVSAK